MTILTYTPVGSRGITFLLKKLRKQKQAVLNITTFIYIIYLFFRWKACQTETGQVSTNVRHGIGLV